MLEITPEQLLLLSILAIALIILLFYYLFFFNRLRKVQTETQNSTIPVSVIISARNEKSNLEKNLPSILSQQYANFEVVVINDTSFDGTKDLLKELEQQHSNLKVVTVELDDRFQRGKKFALTMGIKAASHDQLLFTDADCTPSSPFWIQGMMDAKNGKPIILGNAPLRTRKTPLGALIKYETFHTALQYMTYALRKRTYMGVGRNMSYTKDIFFKNKGFATHQHIMSGDDDLFIQEVASKDNVSVCVNPNALMYSDAPKGIGAWITQKKRHLSTSNLYKPKYKRLLGLYAIAQLLFYVVLILFVSIFISVWYYAVALLALKWIIQWFVMFKPSKILNAKPIGFLIPFYDVLFTFYLALFGVIKQFSKPKKWK
jgi:biofilm PGA synthesis N-glycosyltransferase PgaC